MCVNDPLNNGIPFFANSKLSSTSFESSGLNDNESICHFQTLVWTFGVQSLTMRMTPKNPIATRKCKSVYVGQKTQRRFLKLMEKRGGESRAVQQFYMLSSLILPSRSQKFHNRQKFYKLENVRTFGMLPKT